MFDMKKMKLASSGMWFGIGFGVLTALLVSLGGAAIIAYLICNAYVTQNSLGYLAMAVLAISSALGALVSVGKVKRLRFQVCLITAGVFYLSLLALTALFFGGQYQGMGGPAIMILLGAGAVALLGISTKKGSKMKKLKRAYR